MREQRASHIPPRASRTATAYSSGQDDYDLAADESYYPQRMPTSTRRYVDTRGNQVIQQGNKRIVIHNEPPPKRKTHWLLILGVGMLLMVGLWLGLSWAENWWTNHQLDVAYGFPRIYQTDAVIYAGDSAEHPSHYIFLNLSGTVEIIELPHGDSSHARIYKGPTIFSDTASLVPVTGEFRTVNGKVEMLVHIQNQIILYINDGTQFKPQ